MRQLILLLLLFGLFSCGSIRKTEFFYFSGDHYDWKQKTGNKASSVNGIIYTCWCKPDYIKKHYNFKDAVLVFTYPTKKVDELNFQEVTPHKRVKINE